MAALEDLHVLPQPPVLGLDHPAADRLPTEPQLLGHGLRGRGHRRVVLLVLGHIRTARAFSSGLIFLGLCTSSCDSDKSGIKPVTVQP